MRKSAAKPKPQADFVTQTELRSVVELHDIASDLAIEIRRRIENGARVRKGSYKATLGSGSSPIAEERQHRSGCCMTSLGGLDIHYPERIHAQPATEQPAKAQRARKKAA